MGGWQVVKSHRGIQSGLCVGMVTPATEAELDELGLAADERRPWLDIAGRARSADVCRPRLAGPPRHDSLGNGLGEVQPEARLLLMRRPPASTSGP